MSTTPKPITDTQLVTLRSIEGGHVRVTNDSIETPTGQRVPTVRALIKRGLADIDTYTRKVVLTDAGRAYLAGRTES